MAALVFLVCAARRRVIGGFYRLPHAPCNESDVSAGRACIVMQEGASSSCEMAVRPCCCDQPLSQSELAQHEPDEQAAEACSECGQQINKRFLDQHKAEECILRRKHCKFCGVDFYACDFVEHVNQCDSRTEPCEKCKQRVCLRDLPYHECATEASTGWHQILELDITSSHTAKVTNGRKVCTSCFCTVESSACSQHVVTCGFSAESRCGSCQLPVFVRDIAARLASDCTLHVIGVPPALSGYDVPPVTFAIKPSVSGVSMLKAEQKDESSNIDLCSLECSEAELSSRFASAPTHLSATGRHREVVAPHGATPATADTKQASSASHHLFDDPRNSDNSTASTSTRVTVQPERNASARASSSSYNTFPKQWANAAEIVKRPELHHPAAVSSDEPWRRRDASNSQSKENAESLLLRQCNAVCARSSDDDARNIECQLCGVPFPMDLLSNHQDYCGVMDEHGNHVLEGAFEKKCTGKPKRSANLQNINVSVIAHVGDARATGSSKMLAASYAADAADDEVQLPCQFCQMLFAPLDLDDHQITCPGQVGHCSSPCLLGSQSNKDDLDVGPSIMLAAKYAAGTAEEVQLPCEFCRMLFSAPELDAHQTACHIQRMEHSPHRLSGPQGSGEDALDSGARNELAAKSYAPDAADDETQLPCEFCQMLFAPLDLDYHQAICRLQSGLGSPPPQSGTSTIIQKANAFAGTNYEDDLATGSSHLLAANYAADEADEEVQLPCEFCQMLIAPFELDIHQNACDFRIDRH